MPHITLIFIGQKENVVTLRISENKALRSCRPYSHRCSVPGAQLARTQWIVIDTTTSHTAGPT